MLSVIIVLRNNDKILSARLNPSYQLNYLINMHRSGGLPCLWVIVEYKPLVMSHPRQGVLSERINACAKLGSKNQMMVISAKMLRRLWNPSQGSRPTPQRMYPMCGAQATRHLLTRAETWKLYLRSKSTFYRLLLI